jgi:RNA polymerase sporulation-specific sigma factor
MDEKLTVCLEKIKKGAPGAFDDLTSFYRPLLLSLVDSFEPSMPADSLGREDLMQEATLALYRAALTFDAAQSKVTFGLYAKICIKNRLISALRKQKRQKQKVFDAPPPSASHAGSRFDFEMAIKQFGHLLTRYERQVLNLRLRDLSYKEIAEALHKDPKSVDNALCRIRHKIRQAKQDGQ